jgi:NADH-quinone oxidoreductase subunit N
MAALNAGYLWLAIAGVATSAISAFFYLRVVKTMYMAEPETEIELSTSPSMTLAMAAAVFAVLYFGMYPASILDFARSSIAGLM